MHGVGGLPANCVAAIWQMQVYGFGESERFIGEFMRESSVSGAKPIIATKFAPLPWRLTADAVPAACKASLERLGLQKMVRQ